MIIDENWRELKGYIKCQCENCNKIYTETKGNLLNRERGGAIPGRFCSSNCCVEFRNKNLKGYWTVCENERCKKPIFVKNWRNSYHKHFYCSRECRCVDSRNKIKFNCDECGKESESTPSQYNKCKHHFCSRSCNSKFYSRNQNYMNKRSKLEKYLEIELPKLFPDIKFVFMDRSVLNGLELDIYVELNNIKLGIEFNGPTHYKEVYKNLKLKKVQKRDRKKRYLCKKLGIELKIFNVSKERAFNETQGQKYLKLVKELIDSKIKRATDLNLPPVVTNPLIIPPLSPLPAPPIESEPHQC